MAGTSKLKCKQPPWDPCPLASPAARGVNILVGMDSRRIYNMHDIYTARHGNMHRHRAAGRRHQAAGGASIYELRPARPVPDGPRVPRAAELDAAGLDHDRDAAGAMGVIRHIAVAMRTPRPFMCILGR